MVKKPLTREEFMASIKRFVEVYHTSLKEGNNS
jgi:hypothetical protein